MLESGERAPAAGLWLGPSERVLVPELVEGGPALLLFYYFDWSTT